MERSVAGYSAVGCGRTRPSQEMTCDAPIRNSSRPVSRSTSRQSGNSINSHAIGVGVILAATCDIRIAAESAEFSCPEIDYGLVAGGAGLFAWLKMPEGRVRVYETRDAGSNWTARGDGLPAEHA